ncbi:MAG: hypothetical protein MdMp024_0738 [Bacteroidales bacterium]
MKNKFLLLLLLMGLSVSCDTVDIIVPDKTYCWECIRNTTTSVSIFGLDLSPSSSEDTTTLCDVTENEIKIYERVSTIEVNKDYSTYNMVINYKTVINCTKQNN